MKSSRTLSLNFLSEGAALHASFHTLSYFQRVSGRISPPWQMFVSV